jgi:regulator of cell morphogenesis and NO signaling
MLVQKENRIGDIVAGNFHTAKIFESHGLDFCCGGKKSIGDACIEKHVDAELVINELSKVEDTNQTLSRFDKWEADFLVDYIINNHHSYVLNTVSTIEHHLAKVVSAHGERHPEMAKIQGLFADLTDELLNHMQKEEKMLFPYIKKMHMAYRNTLEMPVPPFGTVGNPIKMMEDEHESAGNLMKLISSLSSGYTPPQDACGTYKVLYGELKEFENDLHMHVHLENNILFPKAAWLERELNKTDSTL